MPFPIELGGEERDLSEMSPPTTRVKLIRQKKRKNLIGQKLLDQGALQHQQIMHIALTIHEKECHHHEETMPFNNKILLSQERMHRDMMKMQRERWEMESEKTRSFQVVMDRTLCVMGMILQTLMYLAQSQMPTAVEPEVQPATPGTAPVELPPSTSVKTIAMIQRDSVVQLENTEMTNKGA